MKDNFHPLIQFYRLLNTAQQYRKYLLIWLAVTLFFFVLGSWNSDLYRYRALSKRGVEVEGYIKQRYFQPEHSALYIYKVGQQEYTGYTYLDFSDYKVKEGDKIEVTYDPKDPGNSCFCKPKELYDNSILTSLVCAFLPTFMWFSALASELREKKKK